MIKPFHLIRPLFTSAISHYSFSKIIKLAPLTYTQITSQKLAKSISSATEIFCSISPSQDQQTPKNSFTQAETFDQFITLIININVKELGKRLFMYTSDQQTDDLLLKLRDENVIGNTIELLIVQPEYTPRLKKFLTNFFHCILLIMRKRIVHSKRKDIDMSLAKKCFSFLNEYITLVELSDQLIINYFLFMTFMKRTNALDSNRSFFVNQKIVIDYILERNDKFRISKRDLSILFGYLTSASVGINYPVKFYSLVRLAYAKLIPQWYLDSEYNTKKILIQLEKMNYDCEKATNGMKYLMKQEVNYDTFGIVLSALNQHIKIKSQIFYGKPVPQEYAQPLKRITEFLRNYDKTKYNPQKKVLSKNLNENWVQELARYLIPTLFKASIWQEDIWLYFADWIQKQKNYQKTPIANLFTIFNLLQIDQEVIPKSILVRLEKTKQLLLMKHNFKIEDVNLIRQYHIEFGDRMPSHYTIQTQISNNLRSFSQKKVIAESLVRIFIVDLLVNDKVVIEINGPSHYIEQEDGKKKRTNLKSAFKKRVLEKLGYKFLEYDLEIVTDGNIEFLTDVNKQIDDMLV